MTNKQIIDLITSRRNEQADLVHLLQQIQQLGLSEAAMNECKAKINSQYAFAERSIVDHLKELKKND